MPFKKPPIVQDKYIQFCKLYLSKSGEKNIPASNDSRRLKPIHGIHLVVMTILMRADIASLLGAKHKQNRTFKIF